MPVEKYSHPDQLRAKIAWQYCQEARSTLDDFEKYVNLVKKLPALVQTIGLGQTVAFLASKSKGDANEKNTAEKLLYQHLEKWLTRTGVPNGPYYKKASEETSTSLLLLHRIVNTNVNSYRRAVEESFAFITWLKYFASTLSTWDEAHPQEEQEIE